MDKFFMLAGMAVVAWWAFGVLLIAFKAPVYVAKGAPITAKIGVIFSGAFVLPYMLFKYGAVPAMILAPEEPSPEEAASIEEFRKALCQCPACKARRGE